MRYRPDDYEEKIGLLPKLPQLSESICEATLEADGLERSFFYYIPKNLPIDAPIVFVLHGSFDTGDIMRLATCGKWDQMADLHKFVVVYPNSYQDRWNDGRKNNTDKIVKKEIREEPFFLSMVDYFYLQFKINRKKIFWFGHSNGGHMVYRLAHTEPRIVSALAVTCANIPAPTNRSIEFTNPPSIPVMLVHGTEDPIAPFQGGSSNIPMIGKLLGPGLSAKETLEYWLDTVKMDANPKCEILPNCKHDCIVEKCLWSRPGCPDVCHIVIHGGGHTMPNISFDFPDFLGRTNRDINISEEAWKFFKKNI